jgi:hypothetical protein
MGYEHKLTNLYQTATQLRVPPSWLRDEALAGRVPCLRIGKRLRFNVEAVEKALAERAAVEGICHAV